MMNDAGSSEVATSIGAEALSSSHSGGVESTDSSTAAEAPAANTVSDETYSDQHFIEGTGTYTVTGEPDTVQAIADLQSSVDGTHYTLIFGIAVFGGVVFAQNLLKGWLHA